MGFSSTDTRTSNSRTPSKVTLVTLDTNFPSFITQYMLRCGALAAGGGGSFASKQVATGRCNWREEAQLELKRLRFKYQKRYVK